MNGLKIANAPITNTIYCGSVLKDRTWGKNRTDVTADALFAVAEHAENFGKPVEVGDGKRKYRITVERIDG